MAEASVTCLFPTKVGPTLDVVLSCLLDTSSILAAVTIPTGSFSPPVITEAMIKGVYLYEIDVTANTITPLSSYDVGVDFVLGDMLDFTPAIQASSARCFGFSVYVYDNSTTYTIDLEVNCGHVATSSSGATFTPGLFQLDPVSHSSVYFTYVELIASPTNSKLDTVGYLSTPTNIPWVVVVSLENIISNLLPT